ncbi:MAG: RlpA-like double-psi beta-barrel domain-containing protein [Patescibacteria group bacterium]|nr:RlpA-like double-psi beta-barrel domain-containing protein [Patescibacteria group bacterium]
MWRMITVILMSMSVLVCTPLVKNANAATNFFGSSTFTPLFLDEGFLGREVNLDLPEINVKVIFGETDIPAPGVLTIITEIPTHATSGLGYPVLSDTIRLHWQTNAPSSPESANLSIYTDKCSADSEYACAIEQNYQGKVSLINLLSSDDNSAQAMVKINSTVKLVQIPKVKEDPGYMTEGTASWYAYKGCDCAASPDFPKGSYVKVTRLNDPSKSVIVRINDYGPERDIFPDRVIDLDKVAFQKIAPLGAGLTNVKVEPVDAPSIPIEPPVQVAPKPAPSPETVTELTWQY